MTIGENYDRKSELKAFDDTKAGVKGLVDGGISKVPRIFIRSKQHDHHHHHQPVINQLNLPIIDLAGLVDKREEVVKEVRDALGSWGFFQIVNHGIPESVLEEMINGVIRFFEQDDEIKKEWYTRDTSKKVVYNSNFDLYTAPAANWRDSFYCAMAPNPPTPQQLPPPCRRGCQTSSLSSDSKSPALPCRLHHKQGQPCTCLTWVVMGQNHFLDFRIIV